MRPPTASRTADSSPIAAAAAEAGRRHGGRWGRDHRCWRRVRPGPGAKPVWEGDEIERIDPVIRQLAAGASAVSVDTRKADVMTAALDAGARMINDVSALTYDDRSASVVAAADVPVVLMHHLGAPETMQDDPRYDDVLVEVYRGSRSALRPREAAGIGRERSSSIPASALARKSLTISS